MRAGLSVPYRDGKRMRDCSVRTVEGFVFPWSDEALSYLWKSSVGSPDDFDILLGQLKEQVQNHQFISNALPELLLELPNHVLEHAPTADALSGLISEIVLADSSAPGLLDVYFWEAAWNLELRVLLRLGSGASDIVIGTVLNLAGLQSFSMGFLADEALVRDIGGVFTALMDVRAVEDKHKPFVAVLALIEGQNRLFDMDIGGFQGMEDGKGFQGTEDGKGFRGTEDVKGFQGTEHMEGFRDEVKISSDWEPFGGVNLCRVPPCCSGNIQKTPLLTLVVDGATVLQRLMAVCQADSSRLMLPAYLMETVMTSQRCWIDNLLYSGDENGIASFAQVICEMWEIMADLWFEFFEYMDRLEAWGGFMSGLMQLHDVFSAELGLVFEEWWFTWSQIPRDENRRDPPPFD
jgi:hypothetical protein